MLKDANFDLNDDQIPSFLMKLPPPDSTELEELAWEIFVLLAHDELDELVQLSEIDKFGSASADKLDMRSMLVDSAE